MSDRVKEKKKKREAAKHSLSQRREERKGGVRQVQENVTRSSPIFKEQARRARRKGGSH